MPEQHTIATFNVNSINMRKEVVASWLAEHQPWVLGLQEIKCRDEAFPREMYEAEGWHVETYGQSAFNGVAFLSKEKPAEVIRHLPGDDGDDHARLIAARWGETWVVNTYIPQGNEVGSTKFAFKLAWYQRFRAWIEEAFKPLDRVIWIGDFNVAPTDDDVYSPEFFEGAVSVTPEERQALEDLRDWGFADVFRHFHPHRKKAFTFFDYRVRDSAKFKKGWRIDHIWVTKPVLAQAVGCDIDMAPRMLEKASDHTPLWARFEW